MHRIIINVYAKPTNRVWVHSYFDVWSLLLFENCSNGIYCHLKRTRNIVCKNNNVKTIKLKQILKSNHVRESKTVQDSLGFWLLHCGFRIADFNRQRESRILELFSGFQIPQQKYISWISDSTSRHFPQIVRVKRRTYLSNCQGIVIEKFYAEFHSTGRQWNIITNQ